MYPGAWKRKYKTFDFKNKKIEFADIKKFIVYFVNVLVWFYLI